MTTAGINIKWISRKRGMSLGELAEMAGMRQNTISRAISGKVTTRQITLNKIAEALNVDLEVLYKQEPEGEFAPATIGEKIQLLCDQKSISQRKLAKLSGLDKKTIGDIIYDKCLMREINLMKIAMALGIEVKDLYPEGMEYEEKPQTIGRRIKYFCAEKDINPSEIARRTGLDYKTILNAINDRHKPRNLTLQDIATVLGVEVCDLCPEEKS